MKEKIQFIDQLTQETLSLTDEMTSQHGDSVYNSDHELEDYFLNKEIGQKMIREKDWVYEPTESKTSFELLKNLIYQFPLPFFEGLYIEKMSCFRLMIPSHYLPSEFIQSAKLECFKDKGNEEFFFDIPENWDIFPDLLVLRKQRQIIENIDFVKIAPFTEFVSCVAQVLNQSKDKSSTAFLFVQDQWLLVFFPKNREEEIILALQLKMNKGVRVIDE